jgi:hypothetical protein
MLAAFQQAIDSSFSTIGVEATYWPKDGAAGEAVRVIPSRPDQRIGDFTDTTVHVETATFEVRASEVPAPKEGDMLTVGDTSYVLQGPPRRDDPRRLVWTLDTRPV